jgi:hypothetical protein
MGENSEERVNLVDKILENSEIFESIPIINRENEDELFGQNGTRIALRCLKNDKYLSIRKDGFSLYCNQDQIRNTETFELFFGETHGHIALRCLANNNFISQKKSAVSISGEFFKQKETFELIKVFDRASFPAVALFYFMIKSK